MSSRATPPTDPLPWAAEGDATPSPGDPLDPAADVPPPAPAATTAPTRRPRRARLARVGAIARGAGLAAVFAVLSLGGAGLAAELQHTPGTPARAELTYAGDTDLTRQLDAAAQDLTALSAQVDRLSTEAKTALTEVTSSDPTRLHDALQRGSEVAAAIDQQSGGLRDRLTGLPGSGPAAELRYRHDILVRRAALIAALDATSTLASEWTRVTARANDAAKLTTLITQHDQTVIGAAALGRQSQFTAAIVQLEAAQGVIDQVVILRGQLVSSSDVNVLDEWIQRNRAYDIALGTLYAALDRSKGRNTLEVQQAYRDERGAFSQLPPDRRAIIVIVAEVAQNGLNQAVLAIEEANGRIEQALSTADGSGTPTS